MRYKLLGNSGLRVSELCLGTMTFGTEWGNGADHPTSRAQFDRFCEAGGNFIDTANRYTEGTSESFLGDFIQAERDALVLATKYSLHTQPGDLNNAGNHRKNLIRSVEGSLERLRTEYIDLLWVHAWDFTTRAEEVMRALDDLVRQGKVHYIGVSDTPAWIVSRANMLAELRGWSQFVGLQIEYSLLQRTVERELIPMARHLDLGVLAWSPLGGGALTGKYLQPATAEETRRLPEDNWKLSKEQRPVVEEVVKIADEIGCSPAQVALNWVRQQAPVTIPIIGARTLEQLEDNLQCLEYPLEDHHLQSLNEVSAIDLGFPMEFLKGEHVQNLLFGEQQHKLDIHNRRV